MLRRYILQVWLIGMVWLVARETIPVTMGYVLHALNVSYKSFVYHQIVVLADQERTGELVGCMVWVVGIVVGQQVHIRVWVDH